MRMKQTMWLSLLLTVIVGMLGSCTDIDIMAPKGPQGERGLSAYEVWKESVLNGSIAWSVDQVEIVDFFKYLKGEKGEDGLNGKSAYETWVEFISQGTAPDPHNPGQAWDPTHNTVQHFWYYLTGASGENGKTPYIGPNGNWFVDNQDTGLPARGADGATPIVTIGTNGNWYVDGVDTGRPSRGHSPVVTIGLNGNWYIDGVDTGRPSRGANGTNGSTPVIAIGTNGNWYINGVDTGMPSRGANGTNGTSPVVTIGANGNWYVNGVDTGQPARGATGANGIDGTSPVITIGANGNWYINGIDTGRPAFGTNGTNGTNGTDGKSAYDLWVAELANNCGTADALLDGKTGLPWDCNKATKADFWQFLRGADGSDATAPADGAPADPIILGKPNVLLTYYNGALREFVNPVDGSVTFAVFDKAGAPVGAGVTVKGLPGMDPALSYITDSEGRIKVPASDLPDGLPIAGRYGATTSVTIGGVTEASAANTVVPNRVHVRIKAQFVYPRQTSLGTNISDALLPNGYNRNFIAILFLIERQIDGVWTTYPETFPTPELESVFVLDHTQPISPSNILRSPNHKARGFFFASAEMTASPKNMYYITRPLVLTESEKNGVAVTSAASSTFAGYRTRYSSYKQLEWSNVDEYYTLLGIGNTYGEEALMTQAVHIPEIYPAPAFTSATIEVKTGETNLWGEYDMTNLPPVYLKYDTPASDTAPWKIQKEAGSVLLTSAYKARMRTNLYMTKYQGATSGSTTSSRKWSAASAPQYKLYSTFENNLYCSIYYMDDPKGRYTHGGGTVDDDRIYSPGYTVYRPTAHYFLVKNGASYVFKDFYGHKPDMVLTQALSPTGWVE